MNATQLLANLADAMAIATHGRLRTQRHSIAA